jgi:murein DD-endopeptidase MepM/ murein hydrolase activator NlpD
MIPVPGSRIPTKGKLSFMVYRGQKRDGRAHYHRGIDLPAPKGSPVVAADSGTVVRTVNSYTPGFAGYGKVVIVHTLGGTYHFYGHLDRIDVKVGDRVRAGDQLGTVGKTKYSREDPTGEFVRSGPHLHFEVSRTPYPKDSEAPRMNPVAELRRLGAHVPAWVVPAARAAAKAGGGGGALLLLAAGLAWSAFSKKR